MPSQSVLLQARYQFSSSHLFLRPAQDAFANASMVICSRCVPTPSTCHRSARPPSVRSWLRRSRRLIHRLFRQSAPVSAGRRGFVINSVTANGSRSVASVGMGRLFDRIAVRASLSLTDLDTLVIDGLALVCPKDILRRLLSVWPVPGVRSPRGLE